MKIKIKGKISTQSEYLPSFSGRGYLAVDGSTVSWVAGGLSRRTNSTRWDYLSAFAVGSGKIWMMWLGDGGGSRPMKTVLQFEGRASEIGQVTSLAREKLAAADWRAAKGDETLDGWTEMWERDGKSWME